MGYRIKSKYGVYLYKLNNECWISFAAGSQWFSKLEEAQDAIDSLVECHVDSIDKLGDYFIVDSMDRIVNSC